MSLVDQSFSVILTVIFYRTAITMGRGIRRLISLFEPLETIINEANDRLQAEVDGREPLEPTTNEEAEAREAYAIFHNLCSHHSLVEQFKAYLQGVHSTSAPCSTAQTNVGGP